LNDLRLDLAESWLELSETIDVSGTPYVAAADIARMVVRLIRTRRLSELDYTSIRDNCIASTSQSARDGFPVTHLLCLFAIRSVNSQESRYSHLRLWARVWYFCPVGSFYLTNASKGQTHARRSGRRFTGRVEVDGDILRSDGGEFAIKLRATIKDGRSVVLAVAPVRLYLADLELISTLLMIDLQGIYVTEADVERVPDTAPFYAVCYALASMYLGLLYGVSEVELAKRAALLKQFGHGGNGTILQPFTLTLLAIWTLTTERPTEAELVDDCRAHLGQFTNSACSLSVLLSHAS
jgi:hypothetical protein